MKTCIYLVFLFCLGSCANRITPTGGEKDVKAPQLVLALPADRSVHFSEREIRLEFDEYVQLNDLQGQFLISPLTVKMPEVNVNRKTVIISLPDSLLPNTTYTLSFGNSITDVHEANPLSGFQYVFSTGDYLDSLTLEGSIRDAAYLEPLKGVTVLAYRQRSDSSDDSLVFKKRPDYFARSSEKGDFNISNMSPGKYQLFAVDDKNNSYTCDNPSDEALAFIDTLIELPGKVYPVFHISLLEPAVLRLLKTSRMDRHSALFSFNKPVDTLLFKTMEGYSWAGHFYQTPNKDTAYLFQQPGASDSLSVLVYDGLQFVDTVMMSLAPPQGSKEPPGKTRIFLRLSPAVTGPASAMVLNTSHPLSTIADAAEVVEDSSKAVKVPLLITDSLSGYFSVLYPWQSGKRYQVKILPGTLKDIYSYTNDTTSFGFLVPGLENTAMLSVKTFGIQHGKNYILQLINEKRELLGESRLQKDTAITFSYLTPGSARLRIIEDSNGDGHWTYGHFGKKRQGERVWMYPETFTLRSNWEMEITFNIQAP